LRGIDVVGTAVVVLLIALAGQDQPADHGPGKNPGAVVSRPAPQASSEGTAAKQPAAVSSAAAVNKGTAASDAAKKLAPTSPSSSEAAKKRTAASPVSPRPAKLGADRDVRVKTRAETNKPRSSFLVPPGGMPGDRYGPSDDINDWNDLPPWRQTSFFGMHARGQFFVFVVDCSESMIDDDRLPRATIELRRSVLALREPQRFEVIFYNTHSIPMPGGPVPRTADLQAKNLLLSWLRLIEPIGGTDPRPAMQQALMLRPDAVFLLSDGAFPEGTVGEVAKLNTRKIPIHCVDMTGGLAGDHLQRIAADSGGQYASRPGDLQAHP
jgi:hypothetical protein